MIKQEQYMDMFCHEKKIIIFSNIYNITKTKFAVYSSFGLSDIGHFPFLIVTGSSFSLDLIYLIFNHYLIINFFNL